ncbi:Aldolase [Mycena venus]|uniref:Aldolase n=1 Tax=Mycena venus TaxID=2733690 RepID=A0A8H6YEN6_9AGAR|nr:Aldolase [Mycena venus]
MSTLIELLETQLNVDVDSMDPEVAMCLPFTPHNMTSNQFVVNEQMQVPKNRELFLNAVKEYGDKGWEAVLDRISALLCAENIGNIQGRVLLQTSPFYAYDTQKVVDHARRYAVELEKVGISKDRFCIKIPATGPSMVACRILLEEGIRTLGTILFSVPQAIAASQAGCLYISPYFNEIAAHNDRTLWPDSDDPATKHPMSHRLLQILEIYKRLYRETGKEQPMIKPAAFISVQEVMACGEMEMHHTTIGPRLLAELTALPAVSSTSTKIPGVAKVDMTRPYANARPTPARLAEMSKSDPLSGTTWDGIVASTNIDYLADNGAALDKAIEADPATKQRVYDALEIFKVGELSSRAIIEKAIEDLQLRA